MHVKKPLKLLAPAVCAVGLLGAGCGETSTSAAGGGTTAPAATTTTSTGGVLGAQASIGSDTLRARAGDIAQMLDRQVTKLRDAGSKQDLLSAITSARTQVLAAADSLDELKLQSAEAQQQRGNLKSLLRSLAADLTTLKVDTQRGDYGAAIGHLTALSTMIQIRQTVQQLGRGGQQSTTRDTLRDQALSARDTLRTQLASVLDADTADRFATRAERLRQTLEQQQQAVRQLQVPQGLTQEKQRLLTFLRSWQSDLKVSEGIARSGRLTRAVTQLGQKSQWRLQQLIDSLESGSS
jgi:hypothetical protein